jgi:glycyl-tRNA synthetase
MKHYEFLETTIKWHLSLGKENYRFHDHEKLAHYANAADMSLIFLLDSKN